MYRTSAGRHKRHFNPGLSCQCEVIIAIYGSMSIFNGVIHHAPACLLTCYLSCRYQSAPLFPVFSCTDFHLFMVGLSIAVRHPELLSRKVTMVWRKKFQKREKRICFKNLRWRWRWRWRFIQHLRRWGGCFYVTPGNPVSFREGLKILNPLGL